MPRMSTPRTADNVSNRISSVMCRRGIQVTDSTRGPSVGQWVSSQTSAAVGASAMT